MTRSFPEMLVRSFARRTLSMRFMPVLILLALVTFQYARSRDLEWLGTLGFILLFSGFPYAAVELAAMDRDGRLDQIRLAGWSRNRVLALVLAASAGPWILAGALLLLVSMLAGGTNHVQVAVAMVLTTWSLALSMKAVGARRTREIDPRIAAAGVAVGAVWSASLYVGTAAANKTPYGTAMLSQASTTVWFAAAIATAVAVFIAWRATPRVLQLVERPMREADRPRFGSGLTRQLRRRCAPALWRGITLMAVPALVLSAIASVLIAFLAMMWWMRVGDPTVMSTLMPGIVCVVIVFFGAGAISGHCREDAEVGRLHLLRLTSDRPLALIRAIGSFWLPFVLGAVTIAIVAGVILRAPPQYLPLALLVIALLGPLPAVEGWCRYLPFGLVVPAALFALLKSSQATELRSIGVVVLCLAALGWIPWVMARETLRDPDHPFLRGLAASLAVGGIAFAIFWPTPEIDRTVPLLQALVLSVFLVHGGSWLAFPRRVRSTPADTWGPPVALVAVIGAVLGLGGHYTIPGALTVAAIPAAALWTGRRIHESLLDRSGWSLKVRTGLALAGLGAAAMIATGAVNRLDAPADRLAAWLKQQELVAAMVALAIALLVEVARVVLLRRHERIPVVARR